MREGEGISGLERVGGRVCGGNRRGLGGGDGVGILIGIFFKVIK